MNLKSRVAGALLSAAIPFLSVGCGYRVAGRTSSLPANVKTIAVLAIENHTQRYRIEQRMTRALVHEFLTRANYRIISDASSADAVLTGRINSLESNAILFDAATGRATTMLVTIHCEVLLEDRQTKKALYRNDNFLFRNEYEVSTDLPSFFEEQDPALDRMSRDFASRLVAAILENF